MFPQGLTGPIGPPGPSGPNGAKVILKHTHNKQSNCDISVFSLSDSLLQGDAGPSGPNGAPGTRGAPVSTF